MTVRYNDGDQCEVKILNSCDGNIGTIIVQLDHSGEYKVEILISCEENTFTIKVQPMDHGQVS